MQTASNWKECKNILCIRPDNMGDLLMSSPAIRALKESFDCKITVLTSSAAGEIASYIPGIDEVIKYDTPWVKNDHPDAIESFEKIIDAIKEKQFDAAVIFSVYSQNPLPSVMVAYLAGIPKRLAYCRENPYALLTDWVPDKEPYDFIQHQVRRDLALVQTVGAGVKNENLRLDTPVNEEAQALKKLQQAGVDLTKPWMILHAGVSEKKREYPDKLWIEAAKMMVRETGYRLVLTGSSSEKKRTDYLQAGIGKNAYSVAGLFSLPEFISLIKKTSLVVSVNTSTIHIAAATGTPVIVLYALTNPQHAPWKAKGKLLLYEADQDLRSKNEVIRYVQENLHPRNIEMVAPSEILKAVQQVVLSADDLLIPEMIPLRCIAEQAF